VDALVAAGEGDGCSSDGGEYYALIITYYLFFPCHHHLGKASLLGCPALCIQLRKCTYLGIGTSSPAKEIWLNPKYHLGGKFTARLSS
jgi:hypothetical protein